MTRLKEKINEALSSVLPITLIVLLLSATITPMPLGTILLFLAGAVLLIVLFQLRPTWLRNGFNAVLDALALFAPFDDFVGGMFSVPDIVYYLSVAGLFLFLTGEALERRRWN